MYSSIGCHRLQGVGMNINDLQLQMSVNSSTGQVCHCLRATFSNPNGIRVCVVKLSWVAKVFQIISLLLECSFLCFLYGL